MPEALYIIDGYNLLQNTSPYREVLERSLEDSRAKLIEDLVNFRALSGRNTTVVFDGGRGKAGGPQKSEVFGVQVWFSGRDQTADSLVEKLALEQSQERKVIVVTSDADQQRAVFRDRVYRETPQRFIDEFLDKKSEALEQAAPRDRHFLEDRLEERVKAELKRLFE